MPGRAVGFRLCVGLNRDFCHPAEAREEGKVPPEMWHSGAGAAGLGQGREL